MSKVTIVLSDQEIIELQEVLIDNDEKASLEFIKKRIAPKLPVKGTANCDSTRINPFLMKEE